MCVAKKRKNDNHEAMCQITGKPINVFNEFGSFCEDMCGFESWVFAKSRAAHMMDDMGPIFEQLKDED